MRKLISMREELSDGGPLALAAKRILLIAAVGETLTDVERATFKALTGRDAEPGVMVELLEVLIGRRGGKSRAMALLCVYLATLCDWSNDLSLGERGLALFLAPSERQALNVFRYAEAVIDNSPLLAGLVTSRTQDTLTPARGIDIEVQCANWRRTRGST